MDFMKGFTMASVIDFAKMERCLGIRFQNRELCKEAFTHKSFSAEQNLNYDNQRLELLGDAVVQILMTEELYRRYPELQEGMLTRIRSAFVNQASLSGFARSIHLGDFLLLGKGEAELHGEDRDSTLCDTFEAFIGAVYLDQGLECAREFFLTILNREVPDPQAVLSCLNPKGRLQEFTQHHRIGRPAYEVIDVAGPPHQPVYTVKVMLESCEPEQASASSRKQAECVAAEKMLVKLQQQIKSPV